jgi:hypothetical protein
MRHPDTTVSLLLFVVGEIVASGRSLGRIFVGTAEWWRIRWVEGR